MKREKRESLPRAAKKKAAVDTRSSSAKSSSPATIPEQVRKCAHCASEKTPQWRAGPSGPKTLCNACGVRYKSGRLVPEYRPAASPTFVLSQHSNLHQRVMEMRVDAAPESAVPESDETAQAERDADAAVS